MEIKKIEKYDVDYPKTNEISKEEIKKKTPKKFLKLSIALAVIQSLPNKVKAIPTPLQIQIAGGMAYIHPMYAVSSNVESLSLCALGLSVISIGITKVIHKVKKIEKPVPKILKVIAIISALFSIIGLVGMFIFK